MTWNLWVSLNGGTSRRLSGVWDLPDRICWSMSSLALKMSGWSPWVQWTAWHLFWLVWAVGMCYSCYMLPLCQLFRLWWLTYSWYRYRQGPVPWLPLYCTFLERCPPLPPADHWTQVDVRLVGLESPQMKHRIWGTWPPSCHSTDVAAHGSAGMTSALQACLSSSQRVRVVVLVLSPDTPSEGKIIHAWDRGQDEGWACALSITCTAFAPTPVQHQYYKGATDSPPPICHRLRGFIVVVVISYGCKLKYV